MHICTYTHRIVDTVHACYIWQKHSCSSLQEATYVTLCLNPIQWLSVLSFPFWHTHTHTHAHTPDSSEIIWLGLFGMWHDCFDIWHEKIVHWCIAVCVCTRVLCGHVLSLERSFCWMRVWLFDTFHIPSPLLLKGQFTFFELGSYEVVLINSQCISFSTCQSACRQSGATERKTSKEATQ